MPLLCCLRLRSNSMQILFFLFFKEQSISTYFNLFCTVYRLVATWYIILLKSIGKLSEIYRVVSICRKIKIKAKHALVSSEGDKRASAKSEKSSKTASKKNAPKATSLLPASQDEKARLVHVIKASGKGYGFFLRVKKGEKGIMNAKLHLRFE